LAQSGHPVSRYSDPVELGLIKSYAQPGGNVTGIMPYVNGLPTKQLELTRELVPGATRIGLLDDVTDPKARPQSQEIKAAGQKLEIKFVFCFGLSCQAQRSQAAHVRNGG
jgi:putative tryptophan/tyrosine transport system substrate-binding protein